MQPIFDDYLDQLTAVHQNMSAALRDLPQAALDWWPGPEINSLAVLAAHSAGSERYWIGQVAGGEPFKRDRAAEFKTSGVDATTLITRLDAALAHSRSVLERLTLADLEKNTGVVHDDRAVMVAWALQHALEHVALHAGHMQLTRQWWEQTQSS
jgi:uncharacterized damage-inducible protein DinB